VVVPRLFVGELLQTAIGYAQLVGLHVPLGVALVAVVWSC